jgi:hypothetical protein
MIEKNDFAGDQCSLNTHVAAIEHIVRLSKDALISTRFPRELLDNYRRAVSAGSGGEELPAVFKTLTRD